MNVLVVLDHPRRSSFCGSVLDEVVAGLETAGHEVEVADLHREGFDPRMTEADEPDWDDSRKRYSDAVLAEQARIMRNDALVLVFPVWWWSMPAMLKGWIDRVWNNGWAYGSHKLAHRRALMIGTCSASAEAFAKRGYDTAIRTQLVVGIANYCGIGDAELVLMHDVTGDADTRAQHLAAARRLGEGFSA